MKTLINKYLQIRTTPPFQIIITNQTTLLLMALFLLFIQTTQAKTKLTGNFLLNNTISSIPLEREENNLYNNKSRAWQAYSRFRSGGKRKFNNQRNDRNGQGRYQSSRRH